MRFRHPFEPVEFEVPDSWITAAGARSFFPSEPAFHATTNPDWPTVNLYLADIEPPRRDDGVAGLREERSVSIMRAMVHRSALPPLEVHRRPGAAERVLVRDGYHRYYLSIALGFTMLPVSIRPYFDWNAL
jgi:hypothetical protein